MVKCLVIIFTSLALLSINVQGVLAYTLAAVQARDKLLCGVEPGVPGFSDTDEDGVWQGFHVDFCRAVGAAVLGDATKVTFVALTRDTCLSALQTGSVDMLALNIAWSMVRDTAFGLRFVGASFYDGQGFLASPARDVEAIEDLDGARICLTPAMDANLRRIGESRDVSYKPVIVDTFADSRAAFLEGRCSVLSGPRYRLYEVLLALDGTELYTMMPDIISMENYGPIVRQNDDLWFSIVRWVLFAILDGEQQDISFPQEGGDAEPDEQMDALFAPFIPIQGATVGLDDQWAMRIIREVGNYGQIYDRNLGEKAGMAIARDLNNLWNKGGLHTVPPLFRRVPAPQASP
ncbi:MAG: transporter substrate-binding domain-containing protein [Desulfofustis sp. PB-SRB1]|jgi:general L-amino acid transport system substrate-binding protein|nr:transporter substrate-binding domain-containing protein [Desulfofustis sp. PB-SRB1]MBM1002004.1 transporter substrate-binding domain-containing protein [Desulfofustis sp. PB-SRB1]HBH27603.1 amino acid ABC transporter substrate-binding protein [Desulfofustis sp.]HBH31212.1 amino acid ABC transporter substrate-binding protein [Desulfofustis sp.]